MPRDGSGVYTQPFPDVAPATTIESAVYNGFVADVVIDLNAARPVVAGGTGATSEAEALFNLGAESAAYAVTNFDSHVWYPGSFRAAGTATGGPVAAHAFAGVVYINEPLTDPPTNQNVVVEARDLDDTSTPGLVYVREKKAGVWSAWTLEGAAALDGKVDVAGDTMTGLLILSGDAAAALGAVTKQQAVMKAGDTMTGALILSGDASAALGAATKQQLEAGDTAVAIAAAPLDALAYNGMQVNGNCEIDQQYAGTSVSLVSNTRFDGWIGLQRPAATGMTCQRVTDAPAGYRNSLKVTVTTGGGISAGEIAGLVASIEGTRVARLGWGAATAQTMSFGFWVKAHRQGTYTGSVRNAASNRSYVFTYVINAADTWEWKTITVTGDVTGTWEKSFLAGMHINFMMAVGSTFQAAAGWNAGSYFGVTGTTNFVANSSDSFQITGLIVLPGLYLPAQARAPFVMRPYGDELAICQRYYEKSYEAETAVGTAATTLGCRVEYIHTASTTTLIADAFFREKRSAPTITTYSTTTGASGKVRDGAVGDVTPTIDLQSQRGFRTTAAVASGSMYWQWTADARF